MYCRGIYIEDITITKVIYKYYGKFACKDLAWVLSRSSLYSFSTVSSKPSALQQGYLWSRCRPPGPRHLRSGLDPHQIQARSMPDPTPGIALVHI